ncbi:MAG: hypothetical protein QS98_C0012G0033 [archaeon GW2011_AR3]|nr:MAG: hypothetical protein QS98_C0012G0033 [archaeon GW2011_AR3]MBS3109016.1 DNA double-strand break repair nuclease NurA [Candidatus Woesearchaeota archaeon]
MDKAIAEAIVRDLPHMENRDEFYARLSKKGNELCRITNNSFSQIGNSTMLQNVLCVDGGNAEILATPSNSVQFIRCCAAYFSHGKRMWTRKTEFYMVASVEESEVNEQVKCTVYSSDGNFAPKSSGLLFDVAKLMASGSNVTNVAKAIDIARRCSEIQFAASLVPELAENTLIVLDGTLEHKHELEQDSFQGLYKAVGGRGMAVCALAKTTSMLSDDGHAIIERLSKLHNNGKWLVRIALRSEKPDPVLVCFARLNEHSRHIFRIEIKLLPGSQDSMVNEIAACLSMDSKDIAFPGYPYGLITADRFARVSSNEAAYLKTVFMARSGKGWDEISRAQYSLNAHDVLDSM